jgi:alkylated DNA repair dioxygenase AlkB
MNVVVPISYAPGFVADPAAVFDKLWNELEWERRGSTPRREYYCNTEPVSYTYGVGAGERTYEPRDWHPSIVSIRAMVEAKLGTELGVVFLNGYENSKDSLNWHSDDSPEMDDDKPIAIVTLGAEREIWFRPNADTFAVTKVKLESGSICVMAPGMQDLFMHRIPRAGFDCGPRISLTFRGYVAT